MSPQEPIHPTSFIPLPSPETSPKDSVQGQSFFSKVWNVFLSVGGKIINQVKNEEDKKISPLQRKIEKKKIDHSLKKCPLLRKEIAELKEMAQALCKEEGESATPFIIRYIDPCLAHMKTLLDICARVRCSSKMYFIESGALDQVFAVQKGIGLQKLKKDLIEGVHKAIYNDLACIASYEESEGYHEAFAKESVKIIVSILIQLVESVPKKDSMKALFRWKQSIDMLRQELMDFALMIIDKQAAMNVPFIDPEMRVAFFQISSLLKNLIVEKSPKDDEVVYLQELDVYTSEDLQKSIEYFLDHFRKINS